MRPVTVQHSIDWLWNELPAVGGFGARFNDVLKYIEQLEASREVALGSPRR